MWGCCREDPASRQHAPNLSQGRNMQQNPPGDLRGWAKLHGRHWSYRTLASEAETARHWMPSLPYAKCPLPFHCADYLIHHQSVHRETLRKISPIAQCRSRLCRGLSGQMQLPNSVSKYQSGGNRWHGTMVSVAPRQQGILRQPLDLACGPEIGNGC